MPPNGHALALEFDPDELEAAVAPKPDAGVPIKVVIGNAMAAAAQAVAVAVLDYRADGTMSATTRDWGGAMVGWVVQLRLDTLGELPEFDVVAFAEGKRELLARRGTVLHRYLDAVMLDAGIDELLNHVLAIASKVARDELKLRGN